MSSRDSKRTGSEQRLRLSPFFSIAVDPSGRSYVAQDTEPYAQYWLTRRYCLLLSLFYGQRGRQPSEAIDAYLRLERPAGRPQAALRRAVAQMLGAGILVGSEDDASRYDRDVVDDYLRYRPLPRAIAAYLIRKGRVAPGRRVLDLAGGPGELAVELAQTGADVSLLELSQAFVKAAARRAKDASVRLTLLHDSCHRLLYREEKYDTVIISQALHYVDDVALSRSLYRVLDEGGRFFVIAPTLELAKDHPLTEIYKAERSFSETVDGLRRRLTLLFRALDPGATDRWDWVPKGPPIVFESARTFQRRRPLPLGFARAFFTKRHVEEYAIAQGVDEAAFWPYLMKRYEAAAPESLLATERWAVLHFRRLRTHSARSSVREVGAKREADPLKVKGCTIERAP
jgi:SAM-dependent methyltransferase